METEPKKLRGFASMDPEKRHEICQKGGKAVPAEKRSFSQNKELASKAGRKGGQSVKPENRTFSKDNALASEAWRMGGAGAHKTKNDA